MRVVIIIAIYVFIGVINYSIIDSLNKKLKGFSMFDKDEFITGLFSVFWPLAFVWYIMLMIYGIVSICISTVIDFINSLFDESEQKQKKINTLSKNKSGDLY